MWWTPRGGGRKLASERETAKGVVDGGPGYRRRERETDGQTERERERVGRPAEITRPAFVFRVLGLTLAPWINGRAGVAILPLWMWCRERERAGATEQLRLIILKLIARARELSYIYAFLLYQLLCSWITFREYFGIFLFLMLRCDGMSFADIIILWRDRLIFRHLHDARLYVCWKWRYIYTGRWPE